MNRTNTPSSARNGNTIAPENGHPTTAPIPNHMIPAAVPSPFRSHSMNAAAPHMPASIAKLLGRNATEACAVPVALMSESARSRPMRAPRTRLVAA